MVESRVTSESAIDDGRERLETWRLARPADYYQADPFFRGVIEHHLGEEAFAGLDARLHEIGVATAGPMEILANECARDHRLPRVERVDGIGRRIEEVVFDPSYHRLGEFFWAAGVISELEQAGREVAAGAIAYLLDHLGEAGHACPVACTAGAIKLLQRAGTDDQRQTYLPGLLEDDYEEAVRAAQFVTEVQGGSDVGANACVAERVADRPGWYAISGEKWFCSVADAELFVVSARPAGGHEGTRGLGLFLVPREIDGRVNGFTINRLKDKLGTRSMATGEIEFDGALGEAIGPIDHGFRNLVSIVLDTSRVHNAISACGLMRRAFLEASTYARHRRAFGQAIGDYPAVREILARMRVRSMAGVATTFRILAMSDRLAKGDGGGDLESARRIDVMLNKYWTAIHATRVARDGIEILGGNGTIEDFSVLPRLYRDAIVIESWEGSHNTLIAQVLRDFAVRGLHEPWLASLRNDLAAVGSTSVATALEKRVDEVEALIHAAVAEDGPERSHFRHVVEMMCRVIDGVALHAQAAWERQNDRRAGGEEAARLFDLLTFEGRSPLDDARIGELQAALAGDDGESQSVR